MTHIVWTLWHTARGHRVTLGSPYDAPVGTVMRCHCGDRRTLI